MLAGSPLFTLKGNSSPFCLLWKTYHYLTFTVLPPSKVYMSMDWCLLLEQSEFAAFKSAQQMAPQDTLHSQAFPVGGLSVVELFLLSRSQTAPLWPGLFPFERACEVLQVSAWSPETSLKPGAFPRVLWLSQSRIEVSQEPVSSTIEN